MKLILTCFTFLAVILTADAQNKAQRLQQAVSLFERDGQLKHATFGFYVINSKTREVIVSRNEAMGMVPASSQKIVTSVAALELLGNDYRYKTVLGYDGRITGTILTGNLYVTGSGDPTLGSWRWPSTKEEAIFSRWATSIRNAGITGIQGVIIGDDRRWGSATVPDGWIWQDIGNYYGAGASSLNWHENQYDLLLKPATRIGDTCTIIATKPALVAAHLVSEATTAIKGSGDNAYIYLPPYASSGFVRGTIPQGTSPFTISGSFPNPALQLVSAFRQTLQQAGIAVKDAMAGRQAPYNQALTPIPLHEHNSPPLDSINFWFLRRSINLYGEALVKAIGFEKAGEGSTEKGVDVVRYFWSQRGIERSALQIIDGSGLSPQNRVTPAALVEVLQYARPRPWFAGFYQALPEINGIKMKSGTLGGAKSYTGFIRSADGNEYSFAIIVNNYAGSASAVQQKMWKLLDILK